MRALQVSTDIVPIGEFKVHASRYIKELGVSRRALIVTQNGKPAAVVVSPEEFDKLSHEARLRAAVADGIADVDGGRVVSDDRMFAELDGEVSAAKKDRGRQRRS